MALVHRQPFGQNFQISIKLKCFWIINTADGESGGDYNEMKMIRIYFKFPLI